MTQYELMVIIRPDLEEEALASAKEKVEQTIAENGGRISEVNEMGKRRFAYEINRLREGIYQVYTFEADRPAVVDELDRVLKIDDRYVRHLIINLTKEKKE